MIKIEIWPNAEFNAERAYDRLPITIGRSRSCDLVIANDLVSSDHARLEEDRGQLKVTDLGSTNGTFVNGRRLDGSTIVTSGDDIRFGQQGPRICILEVELQTPQPLVSPDVPAPGADARPGDEAKSAGRVPPFQGAVSPQPPVRSQDKKDEEFAPAVVVEGPPAPDPLESSSTRMMVKELKQRQNRWLAFAIGTLVGLCTIGLVVATVLYLVLARDSWDPSKIADRYSDSVFLVGYVGPDRSITALGTAFCIDDSGRFATNAHVVEAIEKIHTISGAYPKLIAQGGEFDLDVDSWKQHGDYEPSERYSPDVGVLQARPPKGQRIVHVALARDADLRELKAGTNICYIGFPAYESLDYGQFKEISATVYSGNVARIWTFDHEVGDFESSRVLEHNMYSWGGASGSPIFNSDGKVVALHYSAPPVGGKKQFASLKYGVRVDCLRELLAELDTNAAP